MTGFTACIICSTSLDIDECNSAPCMNGGTCVDAIAEYTCNCNDGYSGTHCETSKCFK